MRSLFLFFFFSFVLSRTPVLTLAVAGCHGDRDKDHRLRANCPAAGFSNVSAGIEPTTQVLLFPKNLFSSLTWSAFQTFTDIYEIDLTGNKVHTLTPALSPVLPSLCVLRLGFNLLTTLSDFSFSACPSLTEVYLDNNAIASLSDHTFSGLVRLEILDLSSNRIKVLPELMLHPLLTIETIYLENNTIRVMPDNWFRPKEEVPYLYLSANPWACFCSLDYLRRYLDDYELNIYVRDGPIIRSDGESVVCDSPHGHRGTPVLNLEVSDLCSSVPETGPTGDLDQPIITPTYDPSFGGATNAPPARPTPPAPPAPPTPSTPPTPPPTTPTPPTPTPAPPTPSTPPTPPPTTPAPPTPAPTPPPPAPTPAPPTSPPPAPPTTPPPAPTPPTPAPPTPAPATPMMPMTLTTLRVVKTHSVATTTISTSDLSWIDEQQGGAGGGGSGGVVVFCLWLFVGCLLLCVLSAVCIMMTAMRLVVWYRRAYKLLRTRQARRPEGAERMRLMADDGTEAVEAGKAVELYRSILFIHREEEGATEVGNAEWAATGGTPLVTLEPSGGRGEAQRGVYRKTMYRLLSKDEEIQGWREVMEECRVPAEDGGRGGGGASGKRYSVILREEREEVEGGRQELDWVLGGWEEPRSSWGEWLGQFLPSMPCGVATPPECEAAQRHEGAT